MVENEVTRLEDLGNFPEHRHTPVLVSWHGARDFPGMKLKMYSMIKQNYTPGERDVTPEGAVEVIDKLARMGNIDPISGLGFAIYSVEKEGILNVFRWGLLEFPHLPKQDLFLVGQRDDRGMPVGIKQVKTDDWGSTCAFEGVIAGHESRAWLDYLGSARETADKVRYLGDYFKQKAIR